MVENEVDKPAVLSLLRCRMALTYMFVLIKEMLSGEPAFKLVKSLQDSDNILH